MYSVHTVCAASPICMMRYPGDPADGCPVALLWGIAIYCSYLSALSTRGPGGVSGLGLDRLRGLRFWISLGLGLGWRVVRAYTYGWTMILRMVCWSDVLLVQRVLPRQKCRKMDLEND